MQNNEESLLIFNLEETELYLSKESNKAEITSLAKTGKSVIAYPSAWADNFGCNYYHRSQAEELQRMKKEKNWSFRQNVTSFSDYHELNITSREKAKENIQAIINDIKTEETNNG